MWLMKRKNKNKSRKKNSRELNTLKEYIYLDDADGLEESNLLGPINYKDKISLITLAACIGSFRCLYSIIDDDKCILNYPIQLSSKNERIVTMEDRLYGSYQSLGDGITISLITDMIYPPIRELLYRELIIENIYTTEVSNLLILKEIDKKYNFIRLNKYYKIGVSRHFIDKPSAPRKAILKKEKVPEGLNNKTYQCPELFNIL